MIENLTMLTLKILLGMVIGGILMFLYLKLKEDK